MIGCCRQCSVSVRNLPLRASRAFLRTSHEHGFQFFRIQHCLAPALELFGLGLAQPLLRPPRQIAEALVQLSKQNLLFAFTKSFPAMRFAPFLDALIQIHANLLQLVRFA